VAKIGWDLFAADLERDIIQAAMDLAGKEEIILTVEEIVEIIMRDTLWTPYEKLGL
jgi:hypothetical protein